MILVAAISAHRSPARTSCRRRPSCARGESPVPCRRGRSTASRFVCSLSASRSWPRRRWWCCPPAHGVSAPGDLRPYRRTHRPRREAPQARRPSAVDDIPDGVDDHERADHEAIAEGLARGADAAFEVAICAHELRNRCARARTDAALGDGARSWRPTLRRSRHRSPGRTSERPVLRSKITAPVTMGMRWRAKVMPMPCSSHQRTTPGMDGHTKQATAREHDSVHRLSASSRA